MVDAGRGSRLAEDPLDCLGMQAGVRGGSRRQLLHRDLEIQQCVQPAVHGRGPAAANGRDKLVPARDKAVVGGSGHVMSPTRSRSGSTLAYHRKPGHINDRRTFALVNTLAAAAGAGKTATRQPDDVPGRGSPRGEPGLFAAYELGETAGGGGVSGYEGP